MIIMSIKEACLIPNNCTLFEGVFISPGPMCPWNLQMTPGESPPWKREALLMWMHPFMESWLSLGESCVCHSPLPPLPTMQTLHYNCFVLCELTVHSTLHAWWCDKVIYKLLPTTCFVASFLHCGFAHTLPSAVKSFSGQDGNSLQS